MKATLGLGAEIDIASGAELGEARDSILSAFNSRKTAVPIRFSRTQTAIADGTNRVIMSVGTPPAGSCWQVMSISTFGTNDHDVVNGIVGALYTGGSVLTPSLANLRIPGISFPAFVALGNEVMWVNPNETLFVVTSTAPVAAQQFGINITVEEWHIPEQNRLNGA